MRLHRTAALLLAAALLVAGCDDGGGPDQDEQVQRDPPPTTTEPSEPDATGTGTDDAEGEPTQGATGAGEPVDEAPVELSVTEVATDLDAPWDVIEHDGRVLLTERDTGRLLEIGPGSVGAGGD
ncbi:MAG: hypothetical protein WD378_06930, partial [Egicoccus sp.]